MSEALDQLKQHLETDTDFQTAYAKIVHDHLTPMLHDLQELSKTAGIDITADELGLGMAQANAALSDADLSAIAGGGSTACSATAAATGGICGAFCILTIGVSAAASGAVAGGATVVSACV
ncbi:hypothetical protein [uncultured Thiohalocapsa sp.]|uniref:hypothetical protein n=1 Tax=uncultured Thiohalocapsa sp. TaxID=768990 RepID=UPI0025F00C57|nr:hypothetical protein [uncultured Thiohalocapsa sp.]